MQKCEKDWIGLRVLSEIWIGMTLKMMNQKD